MSRADCPACGGEGWLPSRPEGDSACPYCKGTGVIEVSRSPRFTITLTFDQSQRVRDLLFTLADVDEGENVALAEIEELVALFPPDPEAEPPGAGRSDPRPDPRTHPEYWTE